MDGLLIATGACAACGTRIPVSPATSAHVEAALPDRPRLTLLLCPPCGERVHGAIADTVAHMRARHGYRGGAARTTERGTRADLRVWLSALVGRRQRGVDHPNGTGDLG